MYPGPIRAGTDMWLVEPALFKVRIIKVAVPCLRCKVLMIRPDDRTRTEPRLGLRDAAKRLLSFHALDDKALDDFFCEVRP